jgi:hypothetical protein
VGKTPTQLGPLERRNLNHWTLRSRCLPPLNWWRKQIQFPKSRVFWFLEYRTMDKVQNAVILSVIHHRQNPLGN